MRLTRLSLLLLALLMSSLAAPAAFGGGRHGGKVGFLHTKAVSGDPDYYIVCSDGRTAVCYGSQSACLQLCATYCKGPCTYDPGTV